MAYLCCVCLHIVVSNTYCVMFLFCFSLSCVPYICMLPVSLDCFCFVFLYLVYPTFVCCQFLWIVFVLFFFILCTLHLYVASFSGLFLFCFSLSCVPYICMLPVSLDCFCFVFLYLVYPTFVCCQFLWIIHF